ncbi:class I SAM-dependent methyltransferase [Dactylosporangium salmoneum]|uniref:Methyltransferase n=1 Tax=Dactylosporangium salmoneum TaxID=53361 RepID=A0ABN3HQL1_9ACTN
MTAQFVLANTRLAPVPLTPEVRLHLADEAIELWERTESANGEQMPPPFWAFAWAGGQALARYVLDNPALVHGRDVLDLAAGSGLVAIAAMHAGAARVTAVEIDALAVAAIGINAEANAVAVTPLLGDVLEQEPDAEVVLAGDVFYSREMTRRMLAYLRRAAGRGARVLVGDPGRAYLPKDHLTLLAEYDVPVPQTLEDAPVKRTTVWAVNP